MRTLVIVLTFISFATFGQTDSLKNDAPRFDTAKAEPKWPFIKYRTPPFIGAIVGYNFYADPYVELGTIINISDSYGTVKNSSAVGPTISYKRYLQKDINSINLDFGIYAYVAAGLGINYTFTNKESNIGFKPFIGLAFYHFQATYGYNFFQEKHNKEMQLGHHCVNLRLAIPICEILKKYN